MVRRKIGVPTQSVGTMNPSLPIFPTLRMGTEIPNALRSLNPSNRRRAAHEDVPTQSVGTMNISNTSAEHYERKH
ncbi:hypothetical protein KQI65_00540 [bacterium]|nr:hypothetical protein [bacterium]